MGIEGNISEAVISGSLSEPELEVEWDDNPEYENDFEEVEIGDQVWIKNNLTEGGTPYDNDEENRVIYGSLFTWEEAMDINIPGYHLPTLAEFEALLLEIGPDAYGHKLKSTDPDYWDDVIGHTNETGFSAKGGGYYDGQLLNYGGLNDQASFWTATEDGEDKAHFVSMFKNESLELYSSSELKLHKASVRLIKDSE